MLVDQIETFFQQYRTYQEINSEALLYVFNTILDTDDTEAMKRFVRLAEVVSEEYDRKKLMESYAVREEFIRPYSTKN